MPSTSKKQHNFMAAVANNPAFAKKVGVPASVGKEFVKADKESGMKAMKKMGGGGMTTAKMGTVRTAAPSRDGVVSKGKTKGTQIKMAGSKPLGMKKGGMAKGMKKGGYC